MNKKFKIIAKKAGFEFWGKEPWRPDGQIIDWSSDYDKEINQFGTLLVKDIAKWLKENSDEGSELAKKLMAEYGQKENLSKNLSTSG